MSNQQDKTALVTGASKGIGAGIAKELAAARVAVVVNYANDRTGAESVVEAITAAGGRATAIQADVAKAADAITGVLAKELAPRGIRVNSVNPGATLSEGTKTAGLYGVGSDIETQLVAMTPLGRMGTPEDIAKVVAFLASDDSGWLTGEVILASGGLR